MESSRAVGPRVLASVSAALAALTTAVYLVVIGRQADPVWVWDIFPWVMLMTIGTVAAAVPALVADDTLARFSSAAAAVILGILGVVSVLSVGAGLLLAAMLSVGAAVSRRSRPPDPAASGDSR